MPCVTPDGKPTISGLAVLNSIKETALPPEEIAAKTGQPLFRVRSGLRELVSAGLVQEESGNYSLTPDGEKLTS